MKKYILTALLLIAAAVTLKAEELSSFILNTKDDSKVEFRFASNPVITFDEADLLITDASLTSVRYPMADVVNIVFSTYTSSVKDVDADHIVVNLTRDLLTVSGLQAGDDVNIYNVDGALLAVAMADSDGSVALSLADLAAGVYIVNMPGKTFKFIR